MSTINVDKINKLPVKLLNKNGANMCWWNAFAQLFTTTRSLTIINKMNVFIKQTYCRSNNYDKIIIITIGIAMF